MFKLRFLAAGVCALVPVLAVHEFQQRSIASRSLKAHTSTRGVTVAAEVRSLRPSYPYSVVPGGVYSPDELRAAVKNDSVVRKHYAGFELSSTRLVKLTADRYEYVSFRLGNRVFWTRKKLRIPQGEVLVTDGDNYARTRCGNRLSDWPNSNTTALQPSDQLLSLPPFSPALLAQLPLAEAPPVSERPVVPGDTSRLAPVLPSPLARSLRPESSWPPLEQPLPGVSVWAPPYSGTPLVPNSPAAPPNLPLTPVIAPSTPPALPPVPEPATISLLGVGLLVCCSLCAYRAARRSRNHDTRARDLRG